MSGIRLKAPLKLGEKIVGRVAEVGETCVFLELQNESRVKLPLPADVLEIINDDHNGMFGGDIIKIARDTSDEYEVEALDAWPNEEK